MINGTHLTFLQALPMPAALINAAERIEGINTAAQQLAGLDCTGWHYVTAFRQPAMLDAIESSLKDGRSRSARFLSNDGAAETVWDVSLNAMDIAGQRMVVATFQDVTALEEAATMRQSFIANVSHELRTPLTAILGFLETLQGPAKNDLAAVERFHGIMQQEAGRMHRLVDDLLSLSRVEDQERIRPTAQVDIVALTKSVMNTLSGMAKARKITLQYKGPDTETILPGDTDQLRQVLQNLIENAVKYGAEGAPVEISLSGPTYEPALQQDGFQIAVADTGDGIEAHQIARLTDRFYRVDSHRSREVGGTGLGLAIVKHIINRHRGRLRILSELGEGSRFVVILPAKITAAPQLGA